MLQTLQGGAAARPFVTHANAFDLDVFLRIAPELFLKRCVVGGIERVFEINRNFRNEGADSTHSPEFAMLEFYAAYEDYDSVAAITPILDPGGCGRGVRLAPRSAHVDGSEFDLGGEWDKVSMFPAVSAAVGEEITPTDSDRAAARRWRTPAGIDVRPGGHPRQAGRGALRAPRRRHLRGADLRHRLPGRHLAAGARAPVADRASSRSGTSTSRASSWVPATPSSSTRWSSASGSRSRPGSLPGVTSRPCRSTRTSCGPWSTACRRWAAWAWASTGLLMALTGVTSIRETILFPLVKPES